MAASGATENIIGNNIRKIRTAHNMTQEELGKVTGVSAMAVSQWENGRAVPRMGAVQAISDYFKVPKSQILDGYKSTMPIGAIIPKAVTTQQVPLVGRVHAGTPEEPSDFDETVDVSVNIMARHPRAYALRVKGDCMDKVFTEIDCILVDPDMTASNGDIVVFAIDEENYVVRRYFKGARKILLSPDSHNPEYDDIVINEENEHLVEFKGVVFWNQSLKEMGYR